LVGPLGAAGPQSLLSNGGFELDANGDGWPDDWPHPAGTGALVEDGNRFLRLEAVPDKMLTVYRVFPVRAGVEAYALSFRVRVNGLQRGKANWHDGRIILDFKNDAGHKLKGGPSHPAFKGTSKGWVQKRVEFLVPEGAKTLEIMPAMFMVKAGSLDLDDLSLEATDPAPIKARIEEAKRKKAEDIARRAAKVKPQVPATPMDKMPLALHVDGNQIKNAKGETIWLQGVAIPSMEWTNGGENILKSVKEALTNWNANTIRLCVKENFWAGKGPYQSDGGAYQRQVVEDAINLAGAHGAYTIIDLHRFRAPEKVHAEFWQDMATRYKNHPAVIFEIFNEPHDISWEVWRNGGFVSTGKKKADVVAENKEKLKGFESIGMQALVDTIRNTGAKNLIIAGGLDWAYDLSGITRGFALDDPGGNGIGYVSHVYPWKRDWQGKFLDAAAKYPVVITECGAPKERMSFIPESAHEDPSTWVPDFLGLVQKHKLHWTAWSFHPKASPVLIKDWTYEPNDYWGLPAKRALAGEVFELKKLR
jgi:hypothetical protein